MNAIINVEPVKSGEYRVRVIEGRGETLHFVTMPPGEYQRLACGKARPEELLKRSFEFLLQREPKESILPRFDITVISRYFPEFEQEMRDSL
jgi:hypothetical protein